MSLRESKKQQSGNPTIKLIAASAGVSPATVSRVLNGTAKVSPLSEKNVRAAIKKHGFRPNSSARRLAGGKSGMVALVLEESSEDFFLNPFWGSVVQGFIGAITDAGLQTTLMIRPKKGLEDSLFDAISRSQVDGIALFSWHRSIKAFESQIPPGLSVVFGGDTGASSNYPFVDVDNKMGGKIATEHLLEAGCSNIFYLTGDLTLESARARLEGFEEAMGEAGLKLNESQILLGDYTASTAESRTLDLIKSGRKFDGLVCGNDLSALGCINILLQNNIRVPEDVKVIGFDDSPVAAENSPTLTTVFQPTRQLGSEAAKMLIKILEGKKMDPIILPVRLVVRESSR